MISRKFTMTVRHYELRSRVLCLGPHDDVPSRLQPFHAGLMESLPAQAINCQCESRNLFQNVPLLTSRTALYTTVYGSVASSLKCLTYLKSRMRLSNPWSQITVTHFNCLSSSVELMLPRERGQLDRRKPQLPGEVIWNDFHATVQHTHV